MLSKEEIKKIIPQREPFLMIDEVESFEPGQSATAYKNVDKEEWYFKGHFPDNPIMPGVLIAESLAQTGAVAILSMEENKGKNALFGGIDKMKFKKMDEYIPFGPFIVLGTFISIFVPFQVIKSILMQIFTLGLYKG